MKEDKPSIRATLDEIKKDAFEAGFKDGWDYLTTVLHTEASKVEGHRKFLGLRAYRVYASEENERVARLFIEEERLSKVKVK